MLETLLETLQSPWALRALVASSLVGITCGMIGCFIVLRNMSLIGDALSHAILPGVFFAFVLIGYSTLGFFIGSVLAGIVTALGITWIQHHAHTRNDAAVGIVFTAMFSIGVIGISWLNNRPGNHLDLKDFLFGTVLGVSNEDLIICLFIALFTILSFILFYRYLFITTFQPTIAETMGISSRSVHYFLMLLLSFAVVSALSTVGVLLVVAMLITPASTALLLSNKLKIVIWISAILGVLSGVVGLIVAIVFDLPPGPAMVLVATTMYLMAMVLAPQKGLVAKYRAKSLQRSRIEREDIIRQAMKQDNTPLEIDAIAEVLGFSTSKMQRHLAYLQRDGALTKQSPPMLTLRGKEIGNTLVRAHRLWESYQVNTMGLNEAQIHEEADRLEHHLSRAFLDEVDAKLGFPEQDPHGSPIPQMSDRPDQPLLHMKPKDRGRIAPNQIDDQIESALWELGLLPNTAFVMSNISNAKVSIKVGKSLVDIPADLATRINVDKR